MEYRKLGNSDLMVSAICMGCMGFGDPHNGQHSWTLDEKRVEKLFKKDLNLVLTSLIQPLVIIKN